VPAGPVATISSFEEDNFHARGPWNMVKVVLAVAVAAVS
jgi:hypothetical protein